MDERKDEGQVLSGSTTWHRENKVLTLNHVEDGNLHEHGKDKMVKLNHEPGGLTSRTKDNEALKPTRELNGFTRWHREIEMVKATWFKEDQAIKPNQKLDEKWNQKDQMVEPNQDQDQDVNEVQEERLSNPFQGKLLPDSDIQERDNHCQPQVVDYDGSTDEQIHAPLNSEQKRHKFEEVKDNETLNTENKSDEIECQTPSLIDFDHMASDKTGEKSDEFHSSSEHYSLADGSPFFLSRELPAWATRQTAQVPPNTHKLAECQGCIKEHGTPHTCDMKEQHQTTATSSSSSSSSSSSTTTTTTQEAIYSSQQLQPSAVNHGSSWVEGHDLHAPPHDSYVPPRDPYIPQSYRGPPPMRPRGSRGGGDGEHVYYHHNYDAEPYDFDEEDYGPYPPPPPHPHHHQEMCSQCPPPPHRHHTHPRDGYAPHHHSHPFNVHDSPYSHGGHVADPYAAVGHYHHHHQQQQQRAPRPSYPHASRPTPVYVGTATSSAGGRHNCATCEQQSKSTRDVRSDNHQHIETTEVVYDVNRNFTSPSSVSMTTVAGGNHSEKSHEQDVRRNLDDVTDDARRSCDVGMKELDDRRFSGDTSNLSHPSEMLNTFLEKNSLQSTGDSNTFKIQLKNVNEPSPFKSGSNDDAPKSETVTTSRAGDASLVVSAAAAPEVAEKEKERKKSPLSFMIDFSSGDAVVGKSMSFEACLPRMLARKASLRKKKTEKEENEDDGKKKMSKFARRVRTDDVNVKKNNTTVDVTSTTSISSKNLSFVDAVDDYDIDDISDETPPFSQRVRRGGSLPLSSRVSSKSKKAERMNPPPPNESFLFPGNSLRTHLRVGTDAIESGVKRSTKAYVDDDDFREKFNVGYKDGAVDRAKSKKKFQELTTKKWTPTFDAASSDVRSQNVDRFKSNRLLIMEADDDVSDRGGFSDAETYTVQAAGPDRMTEKERKEIDRRFGVFAAEETKKNGGGLELSDRTDRLVRMDSRENDFAITFDDDDDEYEDEDEAATTLKREGGGLSEVNVVQSLPAANAPSDDATNQAPVAMAISKVHKKEGIVEDVQSSDDVICFRYDSKLDVSNLSDVTTSALDVAAGVVACNDIQSGKKMIPSVFSRRLLPAVPADGFERDGTAADDCPIVSYDESSDDKDTRMELETLSCRKPTRSSRLYDDALNAADDDEVGGGTFEIFSDAPQLRPASRTTDEMFEESFDDVSESSPAATAKNVPGRNEVKKTDDASPVIAERMTLRRNTYGEVSRSRQEEDERSDSSFDLPRHVGGKTGVNHENEHENHMEKKKLHRARAFQLLPLPYEQPPPKVLNAATTDRILNRSNNSEKTDWRKKSGRNGLTDSPAVNSDGRVLLTAPDVSHTTERRRWNGSPTKLTSCSAKKENLTRLRSDSRNGIPSESPAMPRRTTPGPYLQKTTRPATTESRPESRPTFSSKRHHEKSSGRESEGNKDPDVQSRPPSSSTRQRSLSRPSLLSRKDSDRQKRRLPVGQSLDVSDTSGDSSSMNHETFRRDARGRSSDRKLKSTKSTDDCAASARMKRSSSTGIGIRLLPQTTGTATAASAGDNPKLSAYRDRMSYDPRAMIKRERMQQTNAQRSERSDRRMRSDDTDDVSSSEETSNPSNPSISGLSSGRKSSTLSGKMSNSVTFDVDAAVLRPMPGKTMDQKTLQMIQHLSENIKEMTHQLFQKIRINSPDDDDSHEFSFPSEFDSNSRSSSSEPPLDRILINLKDVETFLRSSTELYNCQIQNCSPL